MEWSSDPIYLVRDYTGKVYSFQLVVSLSPPVSMPLFSFPWQLWLPVVAWTDAREDRVPGFSPQPRTWPSWSLPWLFQGPRGLHHRLSPLIWPPSPPSERPNPGWVRESHCSSHQKHQPLMSLMDNSWISWLKDHFEVARSSYCFVLSLIIDTLNFYFFIYFKTLDVFWASQNCSLLEYFGLGNCLESTNIIVI